MYSILYDNILVYKESDAYSEFSNFDRYPIVIHDVIWYTSEHYFQAMKFPHDPDQQEKIRTTKACHDIKELGSTRQIKLRSDWGEVKENIMMTALRAKFDQYPEMKTIIISNGGKQPSGTYRT